jgi:hypothetical protein
MHMDQQRVRKTYKYPLLPTPEQERMLATVVSAGASSTPLTAGAQSR